VEKLLKKDCGYDSILDMGIIQINGKKSSRIAREYGVSPARVRQYAKDNAIPYVGTENEVDFYVFDEAAEQAFANRNRKSPGRPAVPKPPKVPGKPGRPRKEKPVDTGPKRPVGRPRKYPKEAMDIVPKRPRGRPGKEKP
jgi:hypothetical protein